MAFGEVDGLGGTEPVPGQLPYCAFPGDPRDPSRASATCRWPEACGGIEVLVERALNEGVGEGEVSGGVGEVDAEGDRRPPRPGRRGRHPLRDRRRHQKIEVEVPTDHGGNGRNRPASLPSRSTLAPITSRTESGSAVTSRVASGSHQRALSDGSRFHQVAEHLAHEERIAVGLEVDGVGQSHGFVRSRTGDRPPTP